MMNFAGATRQHAQYHAKRDAARWFASTLRAGALASVAPQERNIFKSLTVHETHRRRATGA